MSARKPEMGKYLLYRFFAKDKHVRRYLPETTRYTHASLKQYMRRYGMVYVKPCAGSQGKGICKVWTTKHGYMVKKNVYAQRACSSLDDVTRYLDEVRDGKAYIVQQGIHLAKYKGKPFDIRVMMQRDRPGGKWQFSGMVAKVAGGNSIVTNTALSHGTVIDVDVALANALGWKQEKCKKCMQKLEQLGFLAARHFDNYQKYRELGFDATVDVKGKVWLIEQNTAPSHRLFARNKQSPGLFRRIEYRWGAYHRAKAKRA